MTRGEVFQQMLDQLLSHLPCPVMERVIRIELTYDAWEAPALPLSYTRLAF